MATVELSQSLSAPRDLHRNQSTFFSSSLDLARRLICLLLCLALTMVHIRAESKPASFDDLRDGYRAGRYSEVLPDLRLLADAGHVGAKALICEAAFAGKGSARSDDIPRPCEEAAAANAPLALGVLAAYRLHGTKSVTANCVVAIEFAERGMKLSDARSTRVMADMYLLGRCKDQDESRAFALYAAAATGGDARAAAYAGSIIFAKHSRTEEEGKRGYEWAKKSALAGDSEGQYLLGYILDFEVVGDHQKEAVQWYEAAASQGNDRAEFALATRLLEGRGGRRSESEAAERLRRAAARGHMDSRHQLALMHLSGLGVSRSDPEAALLLRLNHNGQAGIVRDKSSAVLGAMIVAGRAGPRDLEDARRMFYVAANSVDSATSNNAKPMLAQIEEELRSRNRGSAPSLSAGEKMLLGAIALFGLALLAAPNASTQSQEQGDRERERERNQRCFHDHQNCVARCLTSNDAFQVHSCTIRCEMNQRNCYR